MPYKIVRKERLSYNTVLIEVEGRDIAESAKPGQFIMLRIHDHGERIPLTIADPNPSAGSITLIFQEVGKTTCELGKLEAGDSIRDLVGPLGMPTKIEKVGTVIVVAGGLGTAEMLPIARAFRAVGNRVITIIGARSENLLILEKEMRDASDEVIVTTDDGTKGLKGVVTLPLKKLLDEKVGDLVISCGPVIMMKVVADLTKPYGVKTIASLNPIMVDGSGMCGSCRLTVGGKTRFVCVDGPDFDAHEVDFDELRIRQTVFKKYEKVAYEAWLKEQDEHKCQAFEAPRK
jgi:ferredoxin--NADP+ reductase